MNPKERHHESRFQSRSFILNEILFGIYVFVVLAVDLFCNHFHGTEVRRPMIPFLALLSAALLPLLLGVPPLFRLLRGVNLKPPVSLSRRRKLLIWILCFMATAAVFLVWSWVYYWGSFTPDSFEQLAQAETGIYSDWHPVWHTLLFFTLPMKLFGSRLMIVPFQSLLFSVAMAFCFLTLYELAGFPYAVVSWCAILLNPVLMTEFISPWKDTAFALAAMTAAVMVLRIWCFDKDWTHRPGGSILLGLLLANATLFRHNGILFTGFLLVMLLFIMKKRNWITAFLAFALMLIVVKGPVYSLLNVEKPGRRILETMGLPLTVIANVVKQQPDLLDEETAEFAFSIRPLEDWQKLYTCGNFNSFKFKLEPEELELINSAGAMKILRMMNSCFRIAPTEAAKSLFSLTGLVYSIEDTGDVAENRIDPSMLYENGLLRGFVYEYLLVFQRSIFHYLGNIGTTLVVLIAVMLARCSLTSWYDWKRILLCLSIFCYDFGSMLLLTGPDHRFFQISFLVCPVFVLLMLYENPHRDGVFS